MGSEDDMRRLIFLGGNGHCAARLALARLIAEGDDSPI